MNRGSSSAENFSGCEPAQRSPHDTPLHGEYIFSLGAAASKLSQSESTKPATSAVVSSKMDDSDCTFSRPSKNNQFDDNVIRNVDGTVGAINFYDGLKGSFEYFPDRTVKSVSLSDGRYFERKNTSSPWLGKNGAEADVTKLKVDNGSLVLTDTSGIVSHLSSRSSQRKEYPTFSSEYLIGLYLKNEKRIDVNGDHSVDRKELATVIQSDSFKGEDAQFIAALQSSYESLKRQKSGFFGLTDDSGVTVDDLREFGTKVRSQTEALERANDYKEIVQKQFGLNEGKSVTRSDVANAIANGTFDIKDRERMVHFLDDFDKFKAFDWNPLATKKVDSKSFADGLKKLADADENVVARYMTTWIGSGSNALESAVPKLYANELDPLDSISAAAVRQGSVGNCYFMAALASFAQVSPAKVRDMISTNSDGSYTVVFPGAPSEPITVTKPTESEAMLYGRADRSGYWSQIIEKAYGAYRQKHGQVSWSARDRETGLPVEASDGGDSIANGLRLLSDSEIVKLELSAKSDTDVAAAISLSASNGRPMTLSIQAEQSDVDKPGGQFEGFVNNHAYSVIGFDTVSGMVKVRNPWGRGEPSKDGAPLDGEDDGVFQLPLTDLKKYFHAMAYAK